MDKKTHKSILAIYRKDYEAGKITLIDIKEKTKIPFSTISYFSIKNNWDKKLARKNQILQKKQPLISQIKEYKNDFENGIITKCQIRSQLKCDIVFVLNYIKQNNWDCSKNIQSNIMKSKHNIYEYGSPMTKETQAKGVIAAKIAAEKRKKLKDKCKDFIVDNLFYTSEGIALIYAGIKNNKLSAKHTLYSKHTYTNEQIIHLERKKMQRMW